MLLKLVTFGFFLMLFQHGNAQNQLGVRSDNYMGMEQTWLNPGLAPLQSTTLDIHLIGAGLFFSNNYGFVENASVFSFGKNSTFITNKKLDGKKPSPGTLVSDLYDKGTITYAKFNAHLSGPSILVKLNQGHSMGLFSNFRAAFSLTNMPVNLGYYAYDRKPYNQAFDITPFEGAGAVWLESGLHYGYSISRNNTQISLGVNLKYNRISESGFFSLNQSLQYTKLNPDSVFIEHPEVHFGFTTPNIDKLNWSNLNAFKPKFNFYGQGISTDVGIVMQVNSHYRSGYQYRIGFSLLDFGLSKIKKARYHSSMPIPREITLEFSALENANTIQELESKLSLLAFNDSTASLKNTSFVLGMPAALSLQGDYRMATHFYLGGVWVQPVGLSTHHLTRTATFAIVPRYERRYFASSLSLILSEWQSLRMGYSVRLGFLSIGTDNLGSFLLKKDFTGSDFYLHVGFNIINWRKQKNKRRGRNKKTKLGCYDF